MLPLHRFGLDDNNRLDNRLFVGWFPWVSFCIRDADHDNRSNDCDEHCDGDDVVHVFSFALFLITPLYYTYRQLSMPIMSYSGRLSKFFILSTGHHTHRPTWIVTIGRVGLFN